MHLEDLMVMCDIYNAEILEKLTKQYIAFTILHHKIFAGQHSTLLCQTIYPSIQIFHRLITVLCVVKEKYILMSKEFITQSCI